MKAPQTFTHAEIDQQAYQKREQEMFFKSVFLSVFLRKDDLYYLLKLNQVCNADTMDQSSNTPINVYFSQLPLMMGSKHF